MNDGGVTAREPRCLEIDYGVSKAKTGSLHLRTCSNGIEDGVSGKRLLRVCKCD